MGPTRRVWRAALLSGIALAVATSSPAPGQPVRSPPPLNQYPTRYYIIYTDLGRDDVREAAARMTAMAEEYAARTRGFARPIKDKMPFYLYSNAEDYYAAGAPRSSIGCITGHKLMAIAGPKATAHTWAVVQHEGFHQFAEKTISNKLPIWVEEGLADYFGGSIWTGDGFVSGIIMPHQRWMVQNLIANKQHKPFDAFMAIDSAQWGAKVDFNNYLQGWSMVYFLAHADDGKYRPPFDRVLLAMSKGADWADAWRTQFGDDSEAFEKRWIEYWQAVPKNATADVYAKAMAATLTSFYARTVAQKQKIDTMAEFFRLAEAGQLKLATSDWLPPSLLAGRLEYIKWYGIWTIVREVDKLPYLRCDLRRGAGTIVGRFALTAAGRVGKVEVEINWPAVKATTQPATQPAGQPGGQPGGQPATRPATR